jgi:hypothetical protein
MAKLNDETHVITDGAVKVYRRPNTKRWQATFQIGGRWVRVSTAQRDLEEAKRVGREQYLDYKFREKHGIPMFASSSKMWRTWPLQTCSGSLTPLQTMKDLHKLRSELFKKSYATSRDVTPKAFLNSPPVQQY